MFLSHDRGMTYAVHPHAASLRFADRLRHVTMLTLNTIKPTAVICSCRQERNGRARLFRGQAAIEAIEKAPLEGREMNAMRILSFGWVLALCWAASGSAVARSKWLTPV